MPAAATTPTAATIPTAASHPYGRHYPCGPCDPSPLFFPAFCPSCLPVLLVFWLAVVTPLRAVAVPAHLRAAGPRHLLAGCPRAGVASFRICRVVRERGWDFFLCKRPFCGRTNGAQAGGVAAAKDVL